MRHDRKGLSRFIICPDRVAVDGELETYVATINDALATLKLETYEFEVFLRELLYGEEWYRK